MNMCATTNLGMKGTDPFRGGLGSQTGRGKNIETALLTMAA